MGDFVLYLFKKNKQPREELSSFFHHLLPRYPRFALSSGPSAAKPFLKEANLSPHEPPLEWRGGLNTGLTVHPQDEAALVRFRWIVVVPAQTHKSPV